MRQAVSQRKAWIWLALGLVILFDIVVRVRLLDLPLDRDEGEFAYVGQLMLEGIAPYKLAYVIKLPGTSAVYALVMAVFGQTVPAIHLGLLLANVAAVLLLFRLGQKWFGDAAALIASATYMLMSLSWGVGGMAAHAEQFVAPVALGGILLLLRHLENGRLAALGASGLLFGVAFVLKQPGLLFGIYGGLLLLGSELRARPVNWMRCLRRVSVFSLGVMLPFGVLCLILWQAATFGRFWYWSFKVAGGGWVSMQQGWRDLLWYMNWARMSGQLPLWLLAGVILPFVFWLREAAKVRWPFLGFCAVSILSGAVGLRFAPAYMAMTVPAVGLTVGLGVMAARRLMRESPSLAFAACLPVVVLGIDCGYALVAARDYFFTGTLDRITQKIYPGLPFRESAEVAAYIKKNSTPDSRIAVLGSEAEIYFLAQRHSATGHVSTYILMEEHPYSHAMQEEMAREIKAAKPEYIVYVKHTSSWYPSEHADYTVLNEMMQHIAARYKRVGLAVTDPDSGQPGYYWDSDAEHSTAGDKPHSSCIFVYKALERVKK